MAIDCRIDFRKYHLKKPELSAGQFGKRHLK